MGIKKQSPSVRDRDDKKMKATSHIRDSNVEPLRIYDHALEMAPKTTNTCEGWHNALKSLYMSSHPSMWTMLRGLQKDAAIQKLVLTQHDTAQQDAPKAKYKRIAARLQSMVQEYHNTNDKMKYLRSIAYIQ